MLIERFCQLLAVTEEQLVQPGRIQVFVECRYLLIYLIYHKWSIPKSYIAWFFGYDHTTIIHGIRMIEDMLEVDRGFQEYFDNINALLDLPPEIHNFNLKITTLPNPMIEAELGKGNVRSLVK